MSRNLVQRFERPETCRRLTSEPRKIGIGGRRSRERRTLELKGGRLERPSAAWLTVMRAVPGARQLFTPPPPPQAPKGSHILALPAWRWHPTSQKTGCTPDFSLARGRRENRKPFLAAQGPSVASGGPFVQAQEPAKSIESRILESASTCHRQGRRETRYP